MFDYIILVTNQSGIGRGYYDEEDFIKLHKQIKNFLAKKKFILTIYTFAHIIQNTEKANIKNLVNAENQVIY